MNDLLVIPKCEDHDLPMKYQIPGTYEQRWCGAMYKCPQCGRSRLLPSKELREFLKESEEELCRE
ncbi:MAG: hypothetical protein ILA17_06135 [Ruminococcus sp.]|nr:hypothetical protein [Ruminococcus sp.]